MTRTRLLRGLVVGLLASITAIAGIALVPGAGAAPNYTQTRYAGTDRFDTAALIAAAISEATPTAVIARADIYPDALTGAFAAAANGDGPLLLSRNDSVPQRTMDALRSEGVNTVILLGGPAAISTAAENQLRTAGYAVRRIAGANRYETAAAIARDGQAIVGTVDGGRAALVSSGENFPDALSGAPLSFAVGMPSLLTPPGSLHPATASALQTLAIRNVYLLGGPNAVAQSVEDDLRTRGYNVTRLAGGNRSATSVEVFEFGLDKGIYTNRRFGLARGDTFPDALAYGPLGGRNRPTTAPQGGTADTVSGGFNANGLLLAAGSCTLSDAVENFIAEHSATWTQGEILGGDAAICPAVADQVRQLASTGFAQITLQSTQLTPGGTVRGQVTGEGISSVTVSGCGLNNQAVNRDSSGNFSFALPQSQNQDCDLIFTTTFAGGRTETDRFRITFGQSGQSGSATSRPELLSANIQGTNSTGTAQNPQGTTVRYCFDEPVVASNNPALFHLYRADRTQVNPTAAGGANPTATNVSGTNCVDVLFPQLTATTGGSPSGTGDITLATVDLGAVTDFQGLTNPEGDAGLGSQAGQQFTAGRTQAPDLLSVSSQGTAPSGNASRSIVTFTFDEPAYIQAAGGNGFSVVLLDGTQVPCFGPDETANNPGGQPGTSGNGTTAVNVVCPNASGGGVNGTPLTTGASGNIARGVVAANTVGSSPPAGQTIGGNTGAACNTQVPSNSGGTNAGNFNRCNPMQASDTPDINTPTVELTSVTLQPSTGATQNDVVFFNFDQPITTPGAAGGYAVYRHSGQEVVATTAGTTCVNNLGTAAACPAPQAGTGAQQNQVAVTFPRGTLADVTGGNVDNGTVQSTSAQTNRDDEAAATNAPTGSTGTSAGRTTAPDLIGVSINTTGTFNNQFQATYTFDEAVDLVDRSKLYLYLADGTRLRCTAATEGANSTSTPNSSTVTCTTFDVVAGPGSGSTGVGSGTATNTQLGSATLGTADDGAVVEEGAIVTPGTGTPPGPNTPANPNTANPEGAEFTTGGTGTRTT